METQLTDADVRDFLIRMSFKNASDAVGSAINTAYRDFSRTLSGFQAHPQKAAVRSSAESALRAAILELTSNPVNGQEDFDRWHRKTCDALRSAFGSFHLYWGQAQKWINMALKYLFVLDRDRVEPYWRYLHVPIDNDILNRVADRDPPKFGCAWSRIDSYLDYLNFQNWFRDKCDGIPMDNEWRLWMGESGVIPT